MSAVPDLGPANPKQPERPDDEGSEESKAGAAFGGIVGDAFQPQPPKGDDKPQFPATPGFGTNPNSDGDNEEDGNVLPDPPESVDDDAQGAPVDPETHAKADKAEGLPGGPVLGGAPHTYSPPPREGEDVPDANAPVFPGSVESPPPPTAAELAEREAQRRDMQEIARERRHETEGVHVPPISKFDEMRPGPPRPPTEDDLVRLERDIETLAKIIEEDDNYFGFGTGLNVAKAMHDRRVEELNHYRQIATENGRAYALVQIWYDREREYAMLNTLFWLAIWAYGVVGIFRGMTGVFRLFGLGGGSGWQIPRTGQTIPPPSTSWGSGKTTPPAGSGKTRPFSQGGTWKALPQRSGDMNKGGVRPALPDPKTQRQYDEVNVRIEERAQRIDPQIKRMTEIRYWMEDLNAQRRRLPIDPRYNRDRARIDAELGRLTSQRNKIAPEVQRGLAEQRADIDRAIDLKGKLYPTDPARQPVQPTTPGITKGQLDAALQEGPRIGGAQKTAVGGDTGTNTRPMPTTPTGTQIGPPDARPGTGAPPGSGGTSQRGHIGFKQAVEEESALAQTPAFWGYLGSLAFMDAAITEDGTAAAQSTSGFSRSQVAVVLAAVLALIFAGVVIGYSFFGGNAPVPSTPATPVGVAPTPSAPPIATPTPAANSTSPATGAISGICARVVHDAIGDFLSYIAWDMYWSGVDVDHFTVVLTGANDDEPFELRFADETGAYTGLSGLRGIGEKEVVSVFAVLTDGTIIPVTDDFIDFVGGPVIEVRFPQEDSFGDCPL